MPPPGPLGERLVSALPKATWDAGLACATEQLLMLSTGRASRIDPVSAAGASARCGFPGQARFARLLNGGAFPDELISRLVSDPIDVALARRTYGDGVTLWIIGWGPHVADIDPLPRDLPLDGTLPVTISGVRPGELRLFHAPPHGPVEELGLTRDVVRWVDGFHTPGPHRLEVVLEGQVAHLFTVYVDGPPPPGTPLRSTSAAAPDPVAATETLYDALGVLRQEAGLPGVERFSLFEPVAREHAALMAASGVVAHRIPDVTNGVPTRAADLAHPRARHHENVAAAASAQEALFLVADSPGHLRNLLCDACTHAAIGVALEPVLERTPRLFVTWELLEFPQGPPRKIDHYNR